MRIVKQRQVYWVDLEKVFPKGNHYQKGVRPCLIVSNNLNNKYCDLVTVIPLTTQEDHLPQHRWIYVNYKKNYLLPEMIVTIDKKYLMGYYGHINEGYYTQVLKAMATQFGLSGRIFYDEEDKEFDN